MMGQYDDVSSDEPTEYERVMALQSAIASFNANIPSAERCAERYADAFANYRAFWLIQRWKKWYRIMRHRCEVEARPSTPDWGEAYWYCKICGHRNGAHSDEEIMRCGGEAMLVGKDEAMLLGKERKKVKKTKLGFIEWI